MQGKQGARVVLALATALIVGGAIFGVAASLQPTSATLGAAAQLVSSCQSDPIDVTYQVGGSGDVNGVVLHHIDTASCGGGKLQVSVTDSNAKILAEAATTVASPTMTIAIPPTKSSDVWGVHVSITS